MTLKPAQWAGLAFGVTAIGAYFLVAATLGFHGPPADWRQYGEVPSAGLVRQPICFWTDLALVIAGVYSLRLRPRALGFLIVWMGPASMLEHGTLCSNWGWFDATSIHWFALYVIGAVIALRPVWLLLAAAAVATGALTFPHEPWRGPATGILLGALVLVVPIALRVRGATRQTWRLFFTSLGAFGVATALLIAGRAGGLAAPWGHGAWHVVSAAALALTVELVAELNELRDKMPHPAVARARG